MYTSLAGEVRYIKDSIRWSSTSLKCVPQFSALKSEFQYRSISAGYPVTKKICVNNVFIADGYLMYTS